MFLERWVKQAVDTNKEAVSVELIAFVMSIRNNTISHEETRIDGKVLLTV